MSTTLAAGCLLAILMAIPGAPALGDCARIDDPLQLLDFYLEMAPADWDVIRRDTTFEIERPGTFRCGDEAPLPANIRRKRSDALPSDADPQKVSLKVDFDDSVDGGEWHGHRKISLESGVIRQSLPGALLREGVSWMIMDRAGAVAGSAAWVRVHLNGQLLGVYTRVEEIDKSFLRRHLGEDEGFLYKFDPINADTGTHHRLTREGEDDPYLAALCWPPFDPFCGPPADPLTALKENLDIRQLLTMAAVNTLLGNTDGLLEAEQNYYFYNSPRPRLYFPWDLDLTLWQNLQRPPHVSEVDRQLFEAAPALRAEFDRILRRLCEDTCSDAGIDQLLETITGAVGPAIDADPYNHLEGGFAVELARLGSYMKARTEFILRYLPPSEPSPLVINEVLASNRASGRDEAGESDDWVEILNRGDRDAPLDDLYLTDDPFQPLKWPIPSGTLPAGGHLLIWCDHDAKQGPLHASFQLDQEGDSIGLYRLVDGIPRALDFIRFGPQETDRSIGRLPDGAASLVALPCPTPGLPNQGPCPPPAGSFARGDADGSGGIDITDPIRVVLGLYLGDPLDCRRAADADDSGEIEITDAVYLLGYLFLAGPPPPGPFPGCGEDATSDPLDCLEPSTCPALR